MILNAPEASRIRTSLTPWPAVFMGFPVTARLILRDLVNATRGYEQLATLTAKPSKSLHRMLSPKGNPSMDNLAAIFRASRDRMGVNFEARAVAV